MPNESKNQKGVSPKLLIILVLLALVIVIALVTQTRKTKLPEVAANPPKVETSEEATLGGKRPEAEPPPVVEETEKEPEENAQRAYLVEDFRDTQKNWANFKMTNVAVSAEGIKLQDGQTEGTLESPATALKIPSNMVALLWKETLPDGTQVKPEMQLSYDTENWSDWYPIESTGDDINPLYPDGTPNPNYGYVPGTYVSLGLDLVPFIRYRFNLSRTDLSKPSPVVPIARFYHLDSTLGEGQPITDRSKFPPGPPSLAQQQEEQRRQQEQLNVPPQGNEQPSAPNN